MRISSKGRYAIAALTEMALDETGGYITVSTLARRLDITKVYLEQVFSVLKRNGLLLSGKGAQGGYLLHSAAATITLWDILSLTELHLAERTDKATEGLLPELAVTVQELVFDRLDTALRAALSSVTLADLAARVQAQRHGGNMYYI